MGKRLPSRSPGCTADRSAPRQAVAWPVLDRPEDRNPSSRCPQLRERTGSPFNHFFPDFLAGRDLLVAVLRSNLGNQLRQGRRLAGAAQLQPPFGSGFDLQRIAFLQLGLLDHRLGNADRKAVAPLDHLYLHDTVILSDDTEYIPMYLPCRYAGRSTPPAHSVRLSRWKEVRQPSQLRIADYPEVKRREERL